MEWHLIPILILLAYLLVMTIKMVIHSYLDRENENNGETVRIARNILFIIIIVGWYGGFFIW